MVKDLTTVEQRKATTIQDHLGKFLTEERQILNRWTEYCSKLYNYNTDGDPPVLNCPQTDTEDDHPIFRKEVEAAVQSLKKGKSAWINNIPAEVVQAGGEDVITAADRRMANPMDLVLSHHTSQERQPSAVPEIPNDQPHQLPKKSHAEDHTEQIEVTSGEDHL